VTSRYGGVVSRGVAFVVDGLVVAAMISAATWVVPQLAHSLLGIPTDSTQCGSIAEWWRVRHHLCRALGWVTPAVALSFEPLYKIGFWTLDGRTPGMALLGLRVLRIDGRPIGLPIALRRFALRLLSVLALGLGFLPVLFSARRQAFHDRLAGTIIVHDWLRDLPPSPGHS